MASKSPDIWLFKFECCSSMWPPPKWGSDDPILQCGTSPGDHECKHVHHCMPAHKNICKSAGFYLSKHALLKRSRHVGLCEISLTTCCGPLCGIGLIGKCIPKRAPWWCVHPSIRPCDNSTRMVCPSDISSHMTIDYCDILTQNGCIVHPKMWMFCRMPTLRPLRQYVLQTICPSDNSSILDFTSF
jgi:hypothetical protein